MLNGELLPAKKPDIDNIVKAVLDALNEVAYRDDTQVVELQVRKQYSERPRLEICNERLEEFLSLKREGPRRQKQRIFCLSDVCRALEIANVGNVKQWLSEMGIRTVEPLLTEQIVISGRKRGGIFINESRLCSLILSSWTLINLATKQRRV